MFDNKFVKERIIGGWNSAGMATSLHIMLVSALHTDVYHTPLPFPGLRMQLQVGLISCAAVTRGQKAPATTGWIHRK